MLSGDPQTGVCSVCCEGFTSKWLKSAPSRPAWGRVGSLIKQIPKEPSQKLCMNYGSRSWGAWVVSDAVVIVWPYVWGCFERSIIVLLFLHLPQPALVGRDRWYASLLWWHMGALKAEVIFPRSSASWWQYLDLNPFLPIWGCPGSW